MRIGVDVDEVLYPLIPNLAAWMSHATGRPIEEFPVPTDWDFSKEWDLPYDAAMGLFHEAVDAEAVWRYGAPCKGAQFAMYSLMKAGHTIHLVTDRNVIGTRGKAIQSTAAWLYEEDIPYTSISFVTDKSLLDVDLFVDDRPVNVESMTAKGIESWLVNAAHNMDYEWDKRVTGIDAFAQMVLRQRTISLSGISAGT
jgi:5'(3')-deoxyribonucleotidase